MNLFKNIKLKNQKKHTNYYNEKKANKLHLEIR